MKASDWKKSGHFVSIDKHQVFYWDSGNDNPPLLILHGYPSCSFDYYKTVQKLSENWRVIVHDHLGFGFSDKPVDYSYSLIDQAQVALSLWKKIGISSGHLLGHDYGTSVACEILYQQNIGQCPIKVLSATLGNGSMLIHRAKLLLSQKLLMNSLTGPLLASLSNRSYFHHNFRKLWANPAKYDREEVDQLWDLLISDGGRKVLPKITSYIRQRYTHFDRWVTNGLYKSNIPVNLFWGDKDPVAIIAMAGELHENIAGSQLTVLDGVGHYPMLEAPDRWAECVQDMLNQTE